ncbi:MAG: AIR synthase related protein, partial [Candidatus Thorarchaeota archaeon]
MLPGKVPPDVLERLVFPNVGKRDHNLILGPAIGQDASLIRFGDKVLVVSTDPITGAVEDIGWLAVHINANDIATFGVPPKWFLNSIMLPVGYTQEDLKRIMEQIDEAANSLEISVAGGHTEITEGIDRPIIAGFMLGETSEGE